MATFRKRRRGGCILQNAAVPAALLGLEYMWRKKSLGRKLGRTFRRAIKSRRRRR